MARRPTPSSPSPPQDTPLSVVLVDDDPDRAATLRAALTAGGHRVASLLASPLELYRALPAAAPDVIIVAADSPSRDVLEHIALISRDQPKPIVMFSADGSNDTIRSAIRAGVTAYVVDGLSESRLSPVLAVAVERFAAEQALKQELHAAKSALEDRKNIERAKGIVMRQKGVGEDEAFHLLRKFAMDKGLRMADAAAQLIAVAEVLG